jgi:glyceraldehyde 3-phosphate dehydrogenase
MTARFAINGLGRVGRALVRIARERPGLELAAVNDQAAPEVLARLLAHDTLHGRFPGEVAADGGDLLLDGRRVPVHSVPEPEGIPWDQAGAEIVVEATGRFRSRELAAPHLSAPGGTVSRVVISATAEGADATFCFGLNHERFDPAHHRVVSNASCTTNCVAPLVRVLLDAFGLEHALMQTVHCYTNSQRLVDMAHPDPRRARAAATNIVPTTSDAVEALPLVIPEVAGRFDGVAYRVPVPDGSLVDLSARLGRAVDPEEVRDAFRAAAAGPLARVLAVTEEELVSSDFIGSSYSATVDLPLVQVTGGGRLVRVVAWYDNEWGYASRLADLLHHMVAVIREGAPETVGGTA